MKVTIIGTGYVGLVTGVCLAELGHHVLCLDVDSKKIDMLNQGEVPIYEPGLAPLIEKNRQEGRLFFTTDLEASVAHGEVQFIAVGTPPDEDGSADMQYVLSAARNIGRYMQDYKLIINKSTVPVGTADEVSKVIREELTQRDSSVDFSVVSNPEFLKEGAAVADFMAPDRIVIGCESQDNRAKALIEVLYEFFRQKKSPILYMDIRSSELTKYAANAMLATRISLMNETANLAEKLGADIEQVRLGIGHDSRIGPQFLSAGCGYGGSCFPKDVQALVHMANKCHVQTSILPAVEEVNQRQKTIILEKIKQHFGKQLHGKVFAIWGLAFKPETDDMREAPSRVVIKGLIEQGACVQVYDPVAMKEAQRVLSMDLEQSCQNEIIKNNIRFSPTAQQALIGADALIILTEWNEFKTPDFDFIKSTLKLPIIFDGRNLYQVSQMIHLGFQYYSMGRPSKI